MMRRRTTVTIHGHDLTEHQARLSTAEERTLQNMVRRYMQECERRAVNEARALRLRQRLRRAARAMRKGAEEQ